MGDPGSIPGSGSSLEKEMAIHSNTIAWKIPWTEEPGRLHTVHGVAKSQTWLSHLHCNLSLETPRLINLPRNWLFQYFLDYKALYFSKVLLWSFLLWLLLWILGTWVYQLSLDFYFLFWIFLVFSVVGEGERTGADICIIYEWDYFTLLVEFCQ